MLLMLDGMMLVLRARAMRGKLVGREVRKGRVLVLLMRRGGLKQVVHVRVLLVGEMMRMLCSS